MISDGMLSEFYCIVWSIACFPFLAVGIWQIVKIAKTGVKRVLLLAITGIYMFFASAQEQYFFAGIPTKPTGIAPTSYIFGATPVAVIGALVLLLQNILLGQGGLTTLGANIFSLIIGAFAAVGIRQICYRIKLHRSMSVFLVAIFGSLMVYLTTAVQLALHEAGSIGMFFSGLWKYIVLFSEKQVSLSVVDGVLCVLMFMAIHYFSGEQIDKPREVA